MSLPEPNVDAIRAEFEAFLASDTETEAAPQVFDIAEAREAARRKREEKPLDVLLFSVGAGGTARATVEKKPAGFKLPTFMPGFTLTLPTAAMTIAPVRRLSGRGPRSRRSSVAASRASPTRPRSSDDPPLAQLQLGQVLPLIRPGRSGRLKLNDEQARVLNDRDGRIGLRVVRALLHARAEASGGRCGQTRFPLTELCFQAVARKLGEPVGIKRARAIMRRLVAVGVITGAGSYPQKTGGRYRVRLYRLGVRVGAAVSANTRKRRPCLKPAVGSAKLVKRPHRVRWWQHGLFGDLDGLPPPGLRRRQRTEMRSQEERETWTKDPAGIGACVTGYLASWKETR